MKTLTLSTCALALSSLVLVQMGTTADARARHKKRGIAMSSGQNTTCGGHIGRDAGGGEDAAPGEVVLAAGAVRDTGGGENALGHPPVEIQGAIPPSLVVGHVSQLSQGIEPGSTPTSNT